MTTLLRLASSNETSTLGFLLQILLYLFQTIFIKTSNVIRIAFVTSKSVLFFVVVALTDDDRLEEPLGNVLMESGQIKIGLLKAKTRPNPTLETLAGTILQNPLPLID